MLSTMTDDIKQIQKRINEAKQTKKPDISKRYYGSGLGFRIITELISGVIIGAAIGFFLDDMFKTKPWLLVAFLFFGAAAGILNVYRISKVEGQKRG